MTSRPSASAWAVNVPLTDGLDVDVRDGIGYLTIDRPERRNALSRGLMAAIIGAVDEFGADSSVAAIALTGTGTAAFSAGADLKEMDARARRGESPPIPTYGDGSNVFEAVLSVDKPTVAIVNGPAIGAGCELALACDLRVAADHATLVLPEAKRGLGAHFASVILPRLLPRGIAMEMLYRGEPMTAEKAAHWGLFNATAPAGELPALAHDWLTAIAANAPLTVQRYKRVVTWTSTLAMSEALQVEITPDVYGSRDRQEGVRAFLEKRAPRWEGR